MRIYKMTATFGKLEQAELTLQPGLNIIEAPNEWGKSTWCAFLMAMLYGLDTRAKTTKTALADKERYMPWSGSPMSGRMDIRWQGRDITLERRTRGRIPMGEFRAYETATGLPVPELTSHNCGDILLGVEQSVFRRAGFLRLTDLPVTQDEALRRRLNDLVTTGDESGDADRLAGEMKELKNRIRYNRTGLLPQAEGELEVLERKIAEREDLEKQCRNLSARLEETRAELEALENHRQALAFGRFCAVQTRLEQLCRERDCLEKELTEQERACEKLPGRGDAEEKLSRLGAFLSQWQTIETEIRAAAEPPVPPQEQAPFRDMTGPEAMEMVAGDIRTLETCRDRTAMVIRWIPGILILTAAAVLFFVTEWVYALGAGLPGLLFVAGAIRKNRIMNRKVRELEHKYGTSDPEQWKLLARDHETKWQEYRQKMLAHQQSREDLDSRLIQMRSRRQSLCGGQTPEKVMEIWRQVLRRHDTLEQTRRDFSRTDGLYRTLLETAAPVPEPEMPDELDWTEEETDRMIPQAREEQRRLLGRLGQLQGRMEALGDGGCLTRERERLEKRIRELEDTYAALTLGLETLGEARRELQRRFAPRIAGRAARFLSQMTDGRYDRLLFGEDFSLLTAAREETTLQNTLWYSDGTVDQLYLALRLAVAEELTPHAPLVLDDALVRFDDGRLRAALDILRSMAKEKQVILFTCQGREKQV